MKELVQKAMLDKTNWPLGQKNEEPVTHEDKPITHEKEIIQWLHAYNLDLKEEDIFEILRMKRRWAVTIRWQVTCKKKLGLKTIG